MSNRLILTPLLVLLGACASTGTRSHVPANPLGDPPLYELLAPLPLEGAALDSLTAYERLYPVSFLERVATVAEDPAAPTPVRYNAVTILGERAAVAHLPALRAALGAADPRVRAAAVTAAQKMISAGHADARGVVLAALDDRAPGVQAKALEVLGWSDLPALREFLRRNPEGEVAAIARGLLQAAEERGYPLESTAAGVLRRTSAAGHTVEFVPVTRWAQWDAAVGDVTITPAAGAPFRIDSVEVVRNVVPVTFSPDGRYVAYERARHVFVRDLETGTTRDLGPGLAPRARPFTGDLLFLRERGARTELRERTRISYDVVRAPFAVDGVLPHILGVAGVFVQHDRHGSYSPVRWLHIAERDLKFSLEGDGLETFPLPDPFAGRTEP